MAATSVPAGHHTATPYLIVRNASRAIEFYNKGLGAKELWRLADANGRIAHGEIKVGDSVIMLADEVPEWGNFSPQSSDGSPGHVHLYVDDVDAVVERAVAAGAKLLVPVSDQFYGDRSGRLLDPFGHVWIVATHKEDVPLEDMNKRFTTLLAQHRGG